MTTVEFLSYLRSLDTKVWVEGDRLRCSAPSGVLTEDLRRKLAERKGEIIRFMSQAQNSMDYSSPPITHRAQDDRPPLSFAQQRLWFLDQLDPGNFTYNIPLAVRLRGRLDADALERSLSEIVRRHESLRTTFALADGEPVQVVAPAAHVHLPVTDLRQLPEAEREARARRLAEDEAARPFDLTRGPLFRVSLLRLEDLHHVALLTLHHIVSDEWSKGVLIAELGELYNAFAAGKPSPLREPPIQYRDFARWQREWLKGEVLEAQLSYWRRQLQGLPPLLELPTDRPRPHVQTLHGARQQFILPPDLSAALKALAARSGATLFMVTLAAFKTLLHRYTGQRDVVVGTPIAGRTRLETEGLIGFFINTLVLRTDLTGDPTFAEVLAKVRDVCLGAYAHQDLPFEKLVEELQPERDTSRNPLFQVAFQILNTPRGALELSDLALEPLESGIKATKFDLTLSMVDTEQGLGGSLVYSSELFDDATITRLLTHFRNLIEGIAADPQQRISALPLLKPDERRQLLSRWGDSRARHDHGRCLHELFEARAARSPQAMALVFEGVRLSYDALNRRANQLAHHLRLLGVGPEDRVGIFMERSHEAVVAILAVLKAGAAYVPMDTAYPKERLAFMLEDASMPVLLTQRSLLETLPAHGSQVVCLDSEWESVARQGEGNPSAAVSGDNLAYVIYTSGSTGKPKGVLVSHANVARLFAATEPYFRFDENDVWTLFHSYAFDFSVWELWGALLYGGRLVVVPYLTARSPEAFYDLLREEGVTVLNQTPSAFRQLLKTDGAQGGESAFSPRLIIFGGEALDIQSLGPWFENHPRRGTRLVNMYGITETTVHVTYRPIESGEHEGACGSLIGEPLPDLRMYVLDEHLQPQPVGVSGELYIGGDGVARGYLQRPGLTAARFIPDPFSDEPGARLYRSGDLGRHLANGDTEYRGRIDHQVKVRGYRIELGEIEAALLEQDSVREAVVVIGEDGAGDKRLVAYVVPSARGQSDAINRLREALKDRLPDYMLPSAFVLLESLPLTPHGKVDRRALPAPGRTRSELEGGYVAPRDLLELQLVNLWEEVLEVKPVGVTDNFFDLGGHSLLAVRVFALIQERLNKTLPLATLFRKGTVAHLAELLREQEGPAASGGPLVQIQPQGSKPPFFCVHPGSGEVLCYVPWSRYLGPEQPFYALQDPNLAREEDVDMPLEEMAALYVKAVREVRPHGPYLLGGWSFGGHVAFEMAQQLRRQGQEVSLLVVIDTVSPILVKNKFANAGDADLLAIMVSEMTAEDSGKGIAELRDALAPLSPEGQLKYVYDYLVEYRQLATLQDYTLAYIYRALQVFKARIRAQQAYAPRVYDGRITLFKATRRRDRAEDSDPALGWGEVSTGPVEVHLIPGTHASIALMPHAEVLCRRLRESIDGAK